MIYLALTSCLLSIGLHFYLAIQHIELKLGLAAGKSVCNINATFNCDSVAISSYSTLWGVPIALWGVAAHVILILLTVLALLNLVKNYERTYRFAFYLSTLAALTSLVMGSISSFILKTYCLYCMGAYVLSFVTCFSLWWVTRPNSAEARKDFTSLFGDHKWILGSIFAIPVLAFISYSVMADSYGLGKLNIIVQESVSDWRSATNFNFNQDSGLILEKKPGKSKMTIVEFADFKCPHCRAAYPSLHLFAESNPDDVKLIYKAFPLDGTCNIAIKDKGDGSRCELAQAALCAEKISHKGWDFHNMIFDHQESLFSSVSSDKILQEACDLYQIAFDDLKKCMNTSEIQDMVMALAKEGAEAKIAGVPSIFVNGKPLEHGQLLPVLEAVHQEIISQ